GSGVERRNVVTDDVAECFASMTIAAQGLPQHRDTGLVLHPSLPHHLGLVGAMSPTIARGDVHALFVRRLRAVRPAIDMKTRRIEMAERARQPQTRRRGGGHEDVEGRHPKVVAGIEGAPERVIIEMARRDAWGHET